MLAREFRKVKSYHLGMYYIIFSTVVGDLYYTMKLYIYKSIYSDLLLFEFPISFCNKCVYSVIFWIFSGGHHKY